MNDLKRLLEFHANLKNCDENLFTNADPLQVARRYATPEISLICALFAYGNAKMIVKFLNSLDFSLLDESEESIKQKMKEFKYRFQNTEDVKQIFITFSRIKKELDIQECVKEGMQKNGFIMDGINCLINEIYKLNHYSSDGYRFFFSRNYDKTPVSTYKRYNMYLRWMVRDSDIDMGLFKNIDKSELFIPLDVHTHRVSLALGLISRKSYDFKAVMELTQKLREFDQKDPVKYDFALYRLGQSKEILKLLK